MFKKVYKLTLLSQDTKLKHISFFKGNAWGAVKQAVELAEEKSEKEKDNFACSDIERI